MLVVPASSSNNTYLSRKTNKKVLPANPVRVNNAVDSFQSLVSVGKNVSFCGFLDFFKPNKKNSLENIYDTIEKNQSNGFYSEHKGVNILSKYNLEALNEGQQKDLFRYVVDKWSKAQSYYNRYYYYLIYQSLPANNLIDYNQRKELIKSLVMNSVPDCDFSFCIDYYPDLYEEVVNDIIKDSEAFDLETFKDNFKKIGNIEKCFSMTENNDSIRYILNNLPDIFLTVDNDSEYKQFVEGLKNIEGNWNMQDEYGNTLLHRAVLAENPYLIDLAKNKNIDMTIENKAGQTVMHILNNLSEIHKGGELSYIFDKFNFQKPELVEFARDGVASAVKMILEDELIDVNSRDVLSGDTALIAAARNNYTEVLKLLKNHPKLLVNVCNNDGDNAGIEAAKNGNIETLKLLNTIEDFDINYVNPKTNDSVYTTFKDEKTLDVIMQNKKANPNLGKQPAIFRILDCSREAKSNFAPVLNRFKILCSHPAVNLGVMYQDNDIIEYLRKTEAYLYNTRDKLVPDLMKIMKNKYIDSVKMLVDLDGVLSLDKILEFVTYPGITAKDINTPLNEMNESIGFFLADIDLKRENLATFRKCFKNLTEKGYDFTRVNKAGQNLLAKAKDAQLDILVEYIKNVKG